MVRAQSMPTHDEVTDAVVGASRALVGIAVRSLAATAEDLTMAQHRALVVLSYQGEQRVADLADNLGVNSSTVTRLIARLSRKGFVERVADSTDGRATLIAVSAAGREVTATVRARRRDEIARVMRRMPHSAAPEVVAWLEAFTLAAGESAELSWSLGWTG